jgi:hypothetical protein
MRTTRCNDVLYTAVLSAGTQHISQITTVLTVAAHVFMCFTIIHTNR